jgi:hypothetical protein
VEREDGMSFFKPAALALLGALACTSVQASPAYFYDSNPILGFGGGPGVEFEFSFRVGAGLPDGTYNFADLASLPAGFTYSATDGTPTLTDNADLFGVAGPQFTVAGGEITDFAFYVRDLSVPPSPIYGYATFYAARLAGQTTDNVQLVDPANPNIVGYDYTDASGVHHVPQANRGPDDLSGVWSTGPIPVDVPEPATLVLMSAAGLLLFALRHRASAR